MVIFHKHAVQAEIAVCSGTGAVAAIPAYRTLGSADTLHAVKIQWRRRAVACAVGAKTSGAGAAAGAIYRCVVRDFVAVIFRKHCAVAEIVICFRAGEVLAVFTAVALCTANTRNTILVGGRRQASGSAVGAKADVTAVVAAAL
jgi:hypothetical protein